VGLRRDLSCGPTGVKDQRARRQNL
jgi:hypothetical protein